MNDETKKLLRELEAATGPGDSLPGELDPQTARLREGWLALGRLLEEAQAASPEPASTWRTTPPARPRRWKTAALAAVAASIAVAATVALAVRAMHLRDAARPAPGTIATGDFKPGHGTIEPSGAKDLVPSPVEKTVPGPTTSAAEVRWDDSLDEEIASAAQSLVGIGRDWPVTSARVHVLREGLQEIEEDIGDGTL